MANTTNLDLVKPLGTDHALVSVINSNMDKIDAYAGSVNGSLNSLGDGLAIIANGDTHAAITSGQFVYVRGHSTLSEGLYTATANIAANGALTLSNLSADASGGLNVLNDGKAEKKAAWFKDVASLADLKTAILGAVSGLNDKEITPISFNISYSGDPVIKQWSVYEGLLQVNYKANNVLRFSCLATGENEPLVIEYIGTSAASGTWTIEKLALGGRTTVYPTMDTTKVTVRGTVVAEIRANIATVFIDIKTNSAITGYTKIGSGFPQPNQTIIVPMIDRTTGEVFGMYLDAYGYLMLLDKTSVADRYYTGTVTYVLA